MFPNETACLQHVFRARYDAEMLCPRCGPDARWTPVVERRMMRHRRCNKVVFPYAGTVLEHSRIPAQLWFYLFLHLSNSHESANGYFVSRHLGIDLSTAQRMLRRTRLHLAAIDHQQPLLPISNEQTCVRIVHVRGARDSSRPSYNRAAVLILATGAHIDFAVVDLYRRHRLRSILGKKLPVGANIMTDCAWTERLISNYGHAKSPVRFDPFLKFTKGLDVIYSFLFYFWRGWRLQHQNVNRNYLWLYLAEYRFRYNRRYRSSETFRDMVSAFPSTNPGAMTEMERFYSDIP